MTSSLTEVTEQKNNLWFMDNDHMLLFSLLELEAVPFTLPADNSEIWVTHTLAS